MQTLADMIGKEEIQKSVDEIVTQIELLKQDRAFGNARFVRNLFERTCAKAGTGEKMEKTDKLVLTKEDFCLASSERSFERLIEKKAKNRIGF